jgi:hypothetical protein
MFKTYHVTILNVISIVIVTFGLLSLIINYKDLFVGHGYIGALNFILIGIGIVGLIIDFVLQKLIANYIRVNIIEAILIVALGAWFVI